MSFILARNESPTRYNARQPVLIFLNPEERGRPLLKKLDAFWSQCVNTVYVSRMIGGPSTGTQPKLRGKMASDCVELLLNPFVHQRSEDLVRMFELESASATANA